MVRPGGPAGGRPPAPGACQVKAAYEKLLDYDIEAMKGAVFHLHGDEDERFGETGVRALAEVFPRGLQRKTLADFQRDGHSGVVPLGGPNLTEDLHRMGVRLDDFLVGVDGFAVENKRQLDVVLTFTDDPNATVILMRQGTGFLQFSGPYYRTRYGSPKPAARTPAAAPGR